MKTKIKKVLWLTSLIAMVALNGCKKDDDSADDDDHDEEEELITSVTLSFTDTAGIKPYATASFKDPDGVGGNAPTQFDTIKLSANTVYKASITLLDESKSPAENISNEVKEEDDEHLFCFEVNGANVNIVRTDSDGTYEVGLESRWTVTTASNGTVKVTLKHQPDVKNGNCAPGETDVEITFPVKIQ